MLHIYNLAPGGDDCARVDGCRGGGARSPVAPRPDPNGGCDERGATLVIAPEA